MEFPSLKKAAIEQYTEWQPDTLIVEKKASGSPLIYELRAMGIPVQEFTPTKGNDKITRLMPSLICLPLVCYGHPTGVGLKKSLMK